MAPPRNHNAAAAILLTLLAAPTLAVSCDRVEYAQLKDSDRKELTEIYCRAMSKSKLHEDLRAINQAGFYKALSAGFDTRLYQTRMREQGEAQVACVGVAESASAMYTKKFKAKAAPNCP